MRKSEILAMELMPDHAHLLVEVDPQYGIHKLIKEIKETTFSSSSFSSSYLVDKLLLCVHSRRSPFKCNQAVCGESKSSMIQIQLKLRVKPKQEVILNEWLLVLTRIWNWAIRKIELDGKDGIYYSKSSYCHLH